MLLALVFENYNRAVALVYPPAPIRFAVPYDSFPSPKSGCCSMGFAAWDS